MLATSRCTGFLRAVCLAACILTLAAMSSASAAVVFTGNVDPASPSSWNSYTDGYIGKGSTGSATVDGTSALASDNGYIGSYGSTGTARVTGSGSKWTNNSSLYVGYNGKGTLTVEAGGQVSSGAWGDLGVIMGSTGTATVTGVGSTWTIGVDLDVGVFGSGTLTIEAGGQVSNYKGNLGYDSGSAGTVTVTGNGSMWTNGGTVNVGISSRGTLNIGGGLVKARTATLANGSSGIGILNLDNGGTLQAATIQRGSGSATFNWNDGRIQNYDAATDLAIPSGLVLKLAATGTHAFCVDQNRTATVGAILADATTLGTLTKSGLGTLVLTGANTYTGATDVSAGRLAVNGSLASTSLSIDGGAVLAGTGTIAGSVSVDAAGHIAPGNSVGTLRLNGNLLLASGALLDFELGAAGVNDLIAMPSGTLTLNGQQFSDFTFTPLDGFGPGTYTLIDAAAVQGSLGPDSGMVGGLRASLAISGNDLVLDVVPEPSTLALLGVAAVSLLASAWRRRKRLA